MKWLLLFTIAYCSCVLHAQDLIKNQTAPGVLTQLLGKVEVIRKNIATPIRAEEGTLLYAGDQIKTFETAQATLLLRGSSTIRIYAKTQLIFEESEENKYSQARFFHHQLRLIDGELWANFLPFRQSLQIHLSQVSVDVWSGILRFKEDQDASSVLVSEGQATVSNLDSQIKLSAGFWLNEIQKKDNLKQRMRSVPYHLKLFTQQQNFHIQQSDELLLKLGLQLVDTETRENLHRPMKVYLDSNYYHLSMPQEVKLDQYGFAMVLLSIKAPKFDDKSFNGQIIIRAGVNQIGGYNQGDGNLLLKINAPSQFRHFHSNAKTGILSSADGQHRSF